LLGRDFADFDAGSLLPVAHGAVVAFAAFEFESDDFFAFDVVDNLGADGGSANGRGADGDLVAIADEQNFLELGGFASFGTDQLDIENIAFRHFILFSARAYYCVHKSKSFLKSPLNCLNYCLKQAENAAFFSFFTISGPEAANDEKL
jgi:hypothetical protein